MRRHFIFLLILVLAGGFAIADIPDFTGKRVNDFAGALSGSQEQTLEAMLESAEDQTSSQFVLVVISSLEGDVIEDYSIRLAEKWKIGQKGLDNGAILLVAMKERKLRIEVGYGLEPMLTDLKTGYIIRQLIVPKFKQGDYYGGIYNGLNAITGIVNKEFEISPEELARFKKTRNRTRGKSPIPFGFWIIIVIIVINLMKSGGGRGGRGYRGRGGGVFFGGGGSSFGGGGGSSFGGFSGGGGSFGGGGSSGSW